MPTHLSRYEIKYPSGTYFLEFNYASHFTRNLITFSIKMELRKFVTYCWMYKTQCILETFSKRKILEFR